MATKKELEARITELEAELAQTSVFRQFTDASGQGLAMATLEGNITYVNSTLCHIIEEAKPEAKEEDKEAEPAAEEPEKIIEPPVEEEKKEEVEKPKEEEKKAKPEPVKVEEVKPEKPTPEAPPIPSKSKKINKMSLAEIEVKLEDVKEKMGGWDSKYAQQLIKRKNFLKSIE